MKTLAFGLLMFVCILPLRADILVNGNFADGRAHWKGDAQEQDTGGDLTNPNPQGGVIINLKKDKWTKIYQHFTTHEKRLSYSITFTLSQDYQPDKSQPESGMAPSPGLDDIEGLYPQYGYGRGAWIGIIAQAGLNESSFTLHPDVRKTDSQTLSGLIAGAPDENNDMVIVFAFPPGEGSITITKIALTAPGK